MFVFGAMQRQEDGYSRLKRVILIGDHHQLPPVVKNMAFQKYSHLDQSLFTRFIRLGTPFIQLNAQVRCCSSLDPNVMPHTVCPACAVHCLGMTCDSVKAQVCYGLAACVLGVGTAPGIPDNTCMPLALVQYGRRVSFWLLHFCSLLT